MSDPPITYAPELAARICAELANGKTLRAIEALEGMPARSTIAVWRKRYPEFRSALDEARIEHADTLADEVPHIADTEKDPQKARNMIEARKWRSAVIKPREYGPRMELQVSATLDPAQLHAEGQARLRALREGVPALVPREVDGKVEYVLEPYAPAKEPSIWD
jgi:hypothetical protein